MICRGLVVWSAVAIMSSTCQLSLAESVHLEVGVRSDAAPFSFKSEVHPTRSSSENTGPLQNSGYKGFIVEICDAALVELSKLNKDISISVKEVKAKNRFDLFGSKAGKPIDILCDAATVTRDRLEPGAFTRLGLYASHPIFVSGATFAQIPTALWPEDLCDATIVGVVSRTTTRDFGLKSIEKSGVFGKFSKRIREFLSGEGGNELFASRPECKGLIVYEAPDHKDLARKFCNGNILFYAGDREIVNANLSMLESDDINCDFELSKDTYTDERYAIFSKLHERPNGKNFYIFQFNQILSRNILGKDTLIEAYKSNFENEATIKLKTLIWGLTLNVP